MSPQYRQPRLRRGVALHPASRLFGDGPFQNVHGHQGRKIVGADFCGHLCGDLIPGLAPWSFRRATGDQRRPEGDDEGPCFSSKTGGGAPCFAHISITRLVPRPQTSTALLSSRVLVDLGIGKSTSARCLQSLGIMRCPPAALPPRPTAEVAP